MNLTKPQKLIYDMEKFSGGAISVICGSMLTRDEKDISEIKRAVNEIYRLNDALRIRISEDNGEVMQTVSEYTEQDISVLRFDDKAELDRYAESYAKVAVDLYGKLCEINIVVLPRQYGLLVKMHHIVGDAWTLALMGTQFNALLNGEDVQAYSYTEYVESEKAYIEGKRYAKDREFFLDQFKKCDEVTYLNEKQTNSLSANRKTFIIDAEQTKLLNAYAEANNTSAFMLFTAALSTYMNRTKMNAEKFYIGTAVLNRSGAKEKNTMGMFINTVPMLIELDNGKSFAENLSAIEETAFSVFRHQKYNYGDVLASIRKEYNFTEKLYDVMISYQNATIAGENIETIWYHCGEQSESLQIHIDDRDNEGIFRIHYDYLTDKFTEHEIDRLHDHIYNLLFDAIQDSNKKLYELNILSADERQKLLYDFNDTTMDYPKDKCVHELFEEQVEKTPDKVAVIACDKTLTYAELNEQANKIANALIEKGIKKNDIVAFQVTRKSDLIDLMLGILKTGSSYMPIDPNYPQDRVDYMVKDSGAKFCVNDAMLKKLLCNSNTENPQIYNSAEDRFCVLHTSGSTGLPKGAAIKHMNMVNFIYSNQYLLEGIENIIAINTVTFDVFEMDTIFALVSGVTCVLASEEQQFNQNSFEQMMEQYENCLFWATPTKITNYINNSANGEFFKHINCYVVGGEVLKPELLDTIRQLNHNVNIYTVYGPTETLIYSTLVDVSKTNDITIGHPIANTQIYIVDKYMNPTPIGFMGELCIAGDGVGLGYVNRPDLTETRFVDNLFGNGKLYKTGDLTYWREDGNIGYIGRTDFQVKIRGLRIELGEIENAICGFDGISQAVVVVRKNNEGRQFICAFYTGAEIDAKDIRAHIGKKLPKYMLPHIFTHLDEMPLTASGKINRKALPEIDLENISNDTEYVAPETQMQKALCKLIELVLGTSPVGVFDDFFDLGGDSLKAIEFVSKAHNEGILFNLQNVFDYPTVQELCEYIENGSDQRVSFSDVDFTEVNSLITDNRFSDTPATAAQMRVYTAQSMNGDSTTYNVSYVFKVDSVDINRLQKAVDAMLARHEILRTYFENKDGNIIQVINNTAECKVERLNSADINAFIRPFDLSEVPLLRVGVYENTVMIDMHHIITDGSSMPIFLNELNELYMGRNIENIPVQYKRFAVENSDHTDAEKYWLSVYHNEIPVLEINTDYHRGQKQSFNGNAIYDSVDIELHNKIVAYCKEQGITPYVFYMSGFNILLSKFSGNEDIVVGMPISGRGTGYLETLGMFVNTIALRNKPVGTKTVSEFLQEVKANSVDAIKYQDYPYGELVKKLDINTPNRNPLFDVMFAYQSEQMTDVIFGDKKAELLPVPITTSKYDFTFNVMPRKDNVVIMAEYCTNLYKEHTMQRFIDGYKLILDQMLDGQMQLMDISAITDQERIKLLYEFNDTAVDYPKDKCVHELFEEQVAKTPNKVAVIACDKTLTYGELNEQANRIANALIAKGVKVGDIVAFALPRKSYLIATMFGILKVGAAYLPIDPNYPQDRIDYMLEDSKAKFYINESNIKDFLNSTDISNSNTDMSSDNLCYCIYTSGSTGNPKGVMLRHRNVVNYVNNNNNNVVHSIIPENCETIVSVTTCTFDIFVTESLLPLVNGMSVVLANENQTQVQGELNALLHQYPTDVLQTTPSKMKMLIADKTQTEYLKNLKVIILGGEALDGLLLDELKQLTTANIFNIYGPTETTVWSMNAKMRKEKENETAI